MGKLSILFAVLLNLNFWVTVRSTILKTVLRGLLHCSKYHFIVNEAGYQVHI